MSQIKRRKISLKEKYDIINKVESGVNRKEIMSEYKLKSWSHITEIVKSKERIIECYEKSSQKLSKNMNRIRNANYPDLEEALVLWIKQMRAKNIPLNSHVIREKAIILAKTMNYTDFKASNQYIEGLKKRQNLKWITERGESDSVDEEVINNWEPRLHEMISDFDQKDVYNLDETALFYQLLPNKTYSFSTESGFGCKKLKSRITLLLITNADGSDRMAIMIGKSQKPRAFRGITLPIDYYSQKNSWMNSTIFNKIMQKFNKRMKRMNKNIILFMDNCSCHIQDFDLSNIMVKYFPANTTSVLQVIDFL